MDSYAKNQVSISYIWRWYEVTETSLNEYEKATLHALVTGITSFDPIFQNMSLEEIKEDFNSHRDELEKAVSFSMIASVEGQIRDDYRERIRQKRKDSVSRKFRDLHKRLGNRVRLDEDILEIWKELRQEKRQAISTFTGALKLRYWIAHGRYWVPKLGRTYTPTAVYDITNEISQMIIDG